MSTAIFTHPVCLAHDPGPGHPESSARLVAVLEALDDARFASLARIEAPAATREQLARVHVHDLVDSVLDEPVTAGWRRLDPDTVMSPASADAALRAAGAVCAAVDAAIARHAPARVLRCAAARTSRRRATRRWASACSTTSPSAPRMRSRGTASSASLIVDFDVHHGNGTQDIFWSDPRVLYASSHQWPLYPGTGARNETGAGNIVNAPLRPGSGSAEFRRAYEEIVLPALEQFAPELVLISAGFDAHRLDPLANLDLVADDYTWITERLVDIAERLAQGRIVSSLEGGYSLTALRESTAAHVGALTD